MAKTKRLIRETIDLVDVVVHVIDARIPKSSFIPDINDFTVNKKKIILMSKYDLCDKELTGKWKKYYENLGYEDKNGIMDGLYFDLGPGIDTNIVDGNGEVAYSYPGNVTTHPQQTPVGAKCVNAQSCIGLNNKSDTITINIKKYDSNGKQQKVKYVLNVN